MDKSYVCRGCSCTFLILLVLAKEVKESTDFFHPHSSRRKCLWQCQCVDSQGGECPRWGVASPTAITNGAHFSGISFVSKQVE